MLYKKAKMFNRTYVNNSFAALIYESCAFYTIILKETLFDHRALAFLAFATNQFCSI